MLAGLVQARVEERAVRRVGLDVFEHHPRPAFLDPADGLVDREPGARRSGRVRSTFFRNDLAIATTPVAPVNPHTFLTNIIASTASLTIAAQEQIATFVESDGAVVIDPDGTGRSSRCPSSGRCPRC
jgi:hypothetical protein